MPLYLYLLIGSVIVPGLFSIFFIDVIKRWKHFLISTSIMALIFLVWDAFFTHWGVWGFNPDYLLGFTIFKMPIEEWFFFFIIPFCSLFIHYAVRYGFPNLKLPRRINLIVTLTVIGFSLIIVVTHFDKLYTTVSFIMLALMLLIGTISGLNYLRTFYISFFLILIPFFIVNGVLTGTGIDEPIVWYDNAENLGIRLVTIPVEDIAYAFTMLFGNLLIFETLNNRWKTR